MYQNILDNIKKYCKDRGLLKENMGIVAGLSGGADSVFLLEALRELQNQFRLRICAVHVNHGIRGVFRKICRGNGDSFSQMYGGRANDGG